MMFRRQLEILEDRCTPAQFGIPWGDPSHLTLSFAPNGANVAGQSNQLFTRLNALMPQPEWQAAIFNAVQAWAKVSNVNVGIVADGGQTFGIAGPTQGDTRFGDLRIAAVPMAASSLAEAVPPDPYLSGTFAGDIFLNTSAPFTAASLHAVALHEVGHALGLAPSTDPLSVMHQTLNGNTVLAASDIATVRALYGFRAADQNEGSNGNNSIGNATRLRFAGDFEGQVPSVQWGDITTLADVDVFRLKTPDNYTGPVTVRVQTAGLSLLAPKITIFKENGSVLATGSGWSPDGSILTLTLPSTNSEIDYYIRVETAAGSTATIGRFGLAVTADNLLQPTLLTIDQVLRGPYETVDAEKAGELFLNPTTTFFNDDLHVNDSPATPSVPYSQAGFAAGVVYRLAGSLADAADLDYYQIRSPQSATPWSMTATVRRFSPNGLVPKVQAFTSALQPLASTILANGNGTFAIQVLGVPANQDVLLKVEASGATGNYDLEARFRTTPVAYQDFVAGTIAASASQAVYKLNVTKPILFGLSLIAAGTTGGVRMTLANSAGTILLDLTATAGDTVSGLSTLLVAGTYTVRFTTTAGTASPLTFRVRGSTLTDPIGPSATDPTKKPSMTANLEPTDEVAADKRNSLDPFLWLFSFFA